MVGVGAGDKEARTLPMPRSTRDLVTTTPYRCCGLATLIYRFSVVQLTDAHKLQSATFDALTTERCDLQ